MTRTLTALALALALSGGAQAQPFAAPDRDAPVSAPDLARRAAGGAVAALPTFDSPFLGNPAHITRGGLSVNVLGVSAGAGGNLGETWSFYSDELGPAIEEGLDTIRRDDPDRLAALYAEALRIGGQPKTTDLAVHAPAIRYTRNGLGIGAALYAQSTTRGQITDGGAGIPAVDLYGQADLAVPVVAGLAVPNTGLSVGASATFLQRRVTAKAGPIDSFDPDDEQLYVFSGSTVRLALGAQATDVVLPGLDLGATVSNVGGGIDYAFDRSVVIEGPGTDDAAEIAALEARFDDREPTGAVVRLGAAYRPILNALPGISDAAVALDYTSASTGTADQSLQAGLRFGARARLGGILCLRAGLSQGMPSAGVGIVTRVARIEYATYGVEDGRLLGQQQRRNHVVQLRLGWF